MTASDRLEQELAGWLVETAAPLSADDIDDLLRRTAGVRQRPRWSFLERWLPMSGTALPRPILRSVPARSLAIVLALVLLVAAVIAVGIGSRPPLPAPFRAAGNGEVAFGRGGDLVAVDPATGAERILVAGSTIDAYPVFSPDGTKVAFERSNGGLTVLMVVDVAGGEPIALTDGVGGVYGLQWSPDGRRLAFSDGDLVVVDADGTGGGPLPIQVRAQGFPMWRPSGDDLLFLGADDAEYGSFLVHPDGSDLRPITTADGKIVNDGLALWMPDGHRILTSRVETTAEDGRGMRLHLMTIDPAGRVSDDVAVGPAITDAAGGYFLSRDGTRAMGAVRQPDGDGWRIGVIPLDGRPETLTGPVFHGSGAGFAWAPDGRAIVVTDPNGRATWLLDADGGAAQQATWETDLQDAPAWQPVAR